MKRCVTSRVPPAYVGFWLNLPAAAMRSNPLEEESKRTAM